MIYVQNVCFVGWHLKGAFLKKCADCRWLAWIFLPSSGHCFTAPFHILFPLIAELPPSDIPSKTFIFHLSWLWFCWGWYMFIKKKKKCTHGIVTWAVLKKSSILNWSFFLLPNLFSFTLLPVCIVCVCGCVNWQHMIRMYNSVDITCHNF